MAVWETICLLKEAGTKMSAAMLSLLLLAQQILLPDTLDPICDSNHAFDSLLHNPPCLRRLQGTQPVVALRIFPIDDDPLHIRRAFANAIYQYVCRLSPYMAHFSLFNHGRTEVGLERLALRPVGKENNKHIFRTIEWYISSPLDVSFSKALANIDLSAGGLSDKILTDPGSKDTERSRQKLSDREKRIQAYYTIADECFTFLEELRLCTLE